MAAMPLVEPALPWAEQIDRAKPDLIHGLLKRLVQALMSAEGDAVCGARGDERMNPATAIGHGRGTAGRHDRTGDPEAAEGSHYPEWLLERRKRAERALTTVEATLLAGRVSTGRMEELVETSWR